MLTFGTFQPSTFYVMRTYCQMEVVHANGTLSILILKLLLFQSKYRKILASGHLQSPKTTYFTALDLTQVMLG